jgi:hypothetical protein
MPSGDAQRVWFPEMVDRLRSQWQMASQSMPSSPCVLLAGPSTVVDDLFLNPSNATAITSRATSVTSTGTTLAQLTTDFGGLKRVRSGSVAYMTVTY